MNGNAQREAASVGLAQVRWRKSSHSGANTACVEVGAVAPDVAIRDSKVRNGAIQLVTQSSWRCLVAAIKGDLRMEA